MSLHLIWLHCAKEAKMDELVNVSLPRISPLSLRKKFFFINFARTSHVVRLVDDSSVECCRHQILVTDSIND